jgi:hypothetical protein
MLAHVPSDGRPHLSLQVRDRAKRFGLHLMLEPLRQAKGWVFLIELADNDARQPIGDKAIAALIRDVCLPS